MFIKWNSTDSLPDQREWPIDMAIQVLTSGIAHSDLPSGCFRRLTYRIRDHGQIV